MALLAVGVYVHLKPAAPTADSSRTNFGGKGRVFEPRRRIRLDNILNLTLYLWKDAKERTVFFFSLSALRADGAATVAAATPILGLPLKKSCFAFYFEN